MFFYNCLMTKYIRSALPVISLFLAACTTTEETRTLAMVEESIATTVENDLRVNQVPGALVGIFLPNQPDWIKPFGNTKPTDGVAISADMVWPLRSITKSFTVTLILQLADEGKLGLDDKISKYI